MRARICVQRISRRWCIRERSYFMHSKNQRESADWNCIFHGMIALAEPYSVARASDWNGMPYFSRKWDGSRIYLISPCICLHRIIGVSLAPGIMKRRVSDDEELFFDARETRHFSKVFYKMSLHGKRSTIKCTLSNSSKYGYACTSNGAFDLLRSYVTWLVYKYGRQFGASGARPARKYVMCAKVLPRNVLSQLQWHNKLYY